MVLCGLPLASAQCSYPDKNVGIVVSRPRIENIVFPMVVSCSMIAKLNTSTKPDETKKRSVTTEDTSHTRANMRTTSLDSHLQHEYNL